MADPTFPLDSYREAALFMRRPFTPQAVKFKVQSDLGGKGALIVAYIDARLVIERLNLLLPHKWEDDFKALDGNTVECSLTVDGLTRSDVGQGPGKAGRSDALKRAAVKFGVGVSLYSIPQSMLFLGQHDRYIKRQERKGKEPVTHITDEGDGQLRRKYDKWLHEHGVEHFGPPLDHGDVGVSVGDPDAAEDQPEPQEPIKEIVTGQVADGLRKKAVEHYAQIVKHKGKSAYPQGEFTAGLEAASTSLDHLKAFVKRLDERSVDARLVKPDA